MVKRQRGMALITMLLIFAMVAVLVNGMTAEGFSATRRTGALLHDSQAFAYARGGELLARQILFLDWQGDSTSGEFADALSEEWALVRAPYQPDAGEILLRITDAQQKFNINNLIDAAGQMVDAQLAVLQRLLASLGIAPEIALAIVDWIDADQVPRGYNTEDQGYLAGDNGYRTADRPLQDIAELRAVSGVTAEIFTALQPYITALPVATAVNINTASARLLSAAMPGVDGNQVVLTRGVLDGGFKSLDAFLQDAVTAGVPPPAVPLAVASSYYEVSVAVTFAGREQEWRTLMSRESNSGHIRTLARTRVPFWEFARRGVDAGAEATQP